MTDDTIEVAADKPAPLAIVKAAPVEAVEPDTTAKGRLRAFEDSIVGKDAPRVHGKVERGHGSLYQRNTSPEQKAHHAALEHLVESEDRMAKASAHLATVQAEHDKAEADLAKHESAADGGK
jgi:hypothetical protein